MDSEYGNGHKEPERYSVDDSDNEPQGTMVMEETAFSTSAGSVELKTEVKDGDLCNWNHYSQLQESTPSDSTSSDSTSYLCSRQTSGSSAGEDDQSIRSTQADKASAVVSGLMTVWMVQSPVGQVGDKSSSHKPESCITKSVYNDSLHYQSVDERSDLTSQERQPMENKQFKCDVCYAAFVWKKDLLKHKRRTGEKPFTCDLCGVTFAWKQDLIKHKGLHRGEKLFVCDVYKETFALKGDLIQHRTRHKGEKLFICTECRAAFCKRRTLQEHKRRHRGEGSFRCQFCQATLYQQSVLVHVVHLRRHTGEKPFKCDLCAATFAHKGNMTEHRKKHTGQKPFKCDVCQATFVQKGALKKHEVLHTGERPFVCGVCRATFTQKRNVVNHMRRHTGEWPYKCDLCQATFADKSALRVHIKRHVGLRPIRRAVSGQRMETLQQNVNKNESLNTLVAVALNRNFPCMAEAARNFQSKLGYLHKKIGIP